jgi:cell wall-associated NlpC family hydrolase
MTNSTLPPVKAEELVSKARTLIGTPWHHAGRHATAGLDCIGVLVLSFQACGVDIEDDVNYTHIDEYDRMVKGMALYGDRFMEANQFNPWTLHIGDAVVFRGTLYRNRQVMTHVGILSELFTPGNLGKMIHACNDPASPKVTEEPIRPAWQRIFDSAWRYKNIQ